MIAAARPGIVNPKRPKKLDGLIAEIDKLPTSQQKTLTLAIQARVLQQNQQFARDLGIALDGDEPNV